MSNQLIFTIMGIAIGLFVIVIVAYLFIKKKMQNSDVARIESLRKGTKAKTFSSEVAYQKLYVRYLKLPFLRRYLLKIRRRLEIINIDDEFLTRLQSSKILTRALLIIVPVTLAVILMTKSNPLIMFIILLFELFIIDSIIDGMVDKIDTNLLNQQMDFFAAMRHSYHETNMVGEAIYQTSQDDEHIEMSRQAEKIYEILNSEDPETELEKYYDIAPNNYLKEFAGISYLTQEFGDRKVDGMSLYLKNLDNITQEMQLEILKRDKLNYTFQSLSVIAIVPMIMLEPLKNWALSNFSFTKPFYNGKQGLIVQVLILLLTFVSYILIRKLKDNGAVNTKLENTENPWQAKAYKMKPIKKFVDLFIPKDGTAERRKLKESLKAAASKQKIEWLYINRICLAIVVFIASIFLFVALHKVQVNYIYTEPTTDYNLLGELDGKDYQKAMKVTENHNHFLDMFKGKLDTTQEDIEKAMRKSKIYKESDDAEITTNAEQILEKLKKVNSEYLKWFEFLLAMVFSIIGYSAPVLMLKFQVIIRKMAMEDEVMQYQTIILMLMRLERVDVEMILEWMERYADIFKEPISRCLNNYESGAWESLEDMKEEIAYQPLIRIVESLQTAVEKVPIREAFDELETDREYYQEKRKESNERLISKKGMMGRAIGFAPIVGIFVGYLIVPLIGIGLTSMTTVFNEMNTM
mgnify:FL=1